MLETKKVKQEAKMKNQNAVELGKRNKAMKKQTHIGEYEGKFFLIGADGYSTTCKKWKTRESAEKALQRELKREGEGKPSLLSWEY